MDKISNQTRKKAVNAGFTAAEIAAAVTRTATVAGATTGVIAVTDKVIAAVGVTGQTGYFLTLPAPVVGKRLLFLASVYAYKIQTSGNTVGINGVTGTPAALTVAAATAIELVCTSATNWAVRVGGGAVA